jgi:hypothetical protein
MSAKIEDRLKKILEDNNEKSKNIINDKVGGIFLYGIIVGIIISYTGFLGYFVGVGSGILISNKYNYISDQISLRIGYMFSNTLKQINGETLIKQVF